jgi:hypothetical protein
MRAGSPVISVQVMELADVCLSPCRRYEFLAATNILILERACNDVKLIYKKHNNILSGTEGRARVTLLSRVPRNDGSSCVATGQQKSLYLPKNYMIFCFKKL